MLSATLATSLSNQMLTKDQSNAAWGCRAGHGAAAATPQAAEPAVLIWRPA